MTTALVFAASSTITFGEGLKAMRELNGKHSARSLSLACGVSASYISKIEAGGSVPPLNTFLKIALELGLNDFEIAYLVGLCK